MSYTPGPWKLSDRGCIEADGICVVCFGHDYDDHGGIGGHWPPEPSPHYRSPEYTAFIAPHDEEVAFNTRLICAAPDLYAACQSVTSACDEIPEWDGDDGGVMCEIKLSRRTIAALRAAIENAWKSK